MSDPVRDVGFYARIQRREETLCCATIKIGTDTERFLTSSMVDQHKDTRVLGVLYAWDATRW